MATIFDPNETVICSLEIRTAVGVLVDPATSITITIADPSRTTVVSAQAMTKDSTGLYHYDYIPTVAGGTYTITYIATDGTRVTRLATTFSVV